MTSRKKTDYTPKSKRTGRGGMSVYETPDVKDFGVIRPPRIRASKKKK